MRQVIVTANGSGVTVPVPLDQYISPVNVSYTNSGSGTVQVTNTDPFGSAALVWVTAPTTAPNAAGFLAQPFKAIRLSGAAQGDTLTINQAGIK